MGFFVTVKGGEMIGYEWITWPPHVPRHISDPAGSEHKERTTGGEKKETPQERHLSHRGLRLQPHDELVALWVDELLPEPEERERRHRDDQGEVQASQGEDQTLSQG